jgi:hypothetical protein|tara:strand:+ start:129 stop:425 length:297 start_codon:yes stop_codon:yes gene_type:complete
LSKDFLNVSIVSLFYIKIYRQKKYDGNDNGNSYLDKQVYFEADDLDHLTSNGTDYQTNLEYRNFAINHLNQSFVISSPFGRLVSYINAILDKYVEIKN